MKKLVMGIGLLWATLPAGADVTLHGLFTEHMVLQRGVSVPVFGVAAPGEKVTVSWARQTKSAVAGQDGRWSVKLDALKASAVPANLTVEGKNKIVLNDVLVGDVWVCSGQSNMEWTLGVCQRPEDVASADWPLLRQFVMPRAEASTPSEVARGSWKVCTPASAGAFTAVGFYFGRTMVRETGVPIGLIQAALGATPIEPWIPPEGLAAIPEDRRTAVNVQNVVCQWHCLYFGMIHPLIRFPIKGVLWYQGESNALFNEDPHREETYLLKHRALITSWRKAWNVGDFPFYFVQLASFLPPNNHAQLALRPPNNHPEGGDAWARINMAQLRTLATTPRTGMAVALDLADPGNPGDIHPKNKKEVGERLALWSLAKDYGNRKLVYSGPLYKGMRVEGNKIRLAFDSTGSGLMVANKKGYDPAVPDPQGKLKRFAIAGADKKWVWAEAVIDGKTVVVSSPTVPEPVAVRYAFSVNPEGFNLYNCEGLPASPFRTDDWRE